MLLAAMLILAACPSLSSAQSTPTLSRSTADLESDSSSGAWLNTVNEFPHAQEVTPRSSPKSPILALGLSLGSTAVPIVLPILPQTAVGAEPDGVLKPLGISFIFGGLIAGPSVGHLYSAGYWQALIGSSIRALGTTGLVVANNQRFAGLGGQETGYNDGAVLLAFASSIALAGTAIYDLVTVWGAATDYNEARGLTAQVAPAVGPKQAGLTLRLQF